MTFLLCRYDLKMFTEKPSGKGKSIVFLRNHGYVKSMHGMQYENCLKKSTSSFVKAMAVPLHA